MLKNANTDLVVVKEEPIGDGKFVNLMVLAVQHGEEENSNDTMVGAKEVFTKDDDGNKVLVSTSTVVGSTTHPYGLEIFSDGKVIINVKKYNTTEDAQNDSNLEVGETYKCNGFLMYKQ